MKKIGKAAVLAVVAVSLAGCSGNHSESSNSSAVPSTLSPVPSGSASATTQSATRLELDQSEFALKQWKTDGSHTTTVAGKLTLDGKPVVGAVLHAGSAKRDIVTDTDGSFQLLVDQSLLAVTEIKPVAVDKATVDGSPLDVNTVDQVKQTSAAIRVYYPIQVTGTEPSKKHPGQIDVHARILSNKGDVVSFFQVDKYRIGGKVMDADGNPMKDAVVWIDRDEGEGFAKSTPTDDKGVYELFYLPEEDEGTNLTVTVGTLRYTLPKNKVFHIPEETSVEISIMLPKEGTVITDKPPTLVSHTSPGAMYTGILAGLNVPDGTNYTVTIPDKEGNFTLTIAQDIWDAKPTFFETKMTKFVSDRNLSWGDELPSDFIEPRKSDPTDIQASST